MFLPVFYLSVCFVIVFKFSGEVKHILSFGAHNRILFRSGALTKCKMISVYAPINTFMI